MSYEMFKNTEPEVLAIIFVLSFIITVCSYLFVPVVLILTGKKYSEKEIKRIVIINGIVWSILFFIIESAQGEAKPNIAPCVLWSSVAYAIMSKKCLKTDENEIVNINEDSNVSEESTADKKITHICLSNQNETPTEHGNFNTYAKDILLAPTETITAEKAQSQLQSQPKEFNAIDLAKELSEKCAKTVIQINRKCNEIGIDYNERQLAISTFAYFFAQWAYTSKSITFAQVEKVQELYKEQFSEFNKVEFQDDSFKDVMENEQMFDATLERFLQYAKIYFNNETNSFSNEMIEKYILEFILSKADLDRLKDNI